ncbi:MAG: serine/threonine-protein kinase [Planctomycetota bacterium]
MNEPDLIDDLQPTVLYSPTVDASPTATRTSDATNAKAASAEGAGGPRWSFEGKQLGPYRLEGRLGAGGMGEVYEAEHLLLERRCAVKVIQPEGRSDGKTLARFEQEVRAAAKLTHFNAVQIYDYGRTDNGTFYYAMELLPGLNLDELVRRHGPLPPERAVSFLRQTCNALHEAHSIGLIHGDIKPANIFAATRGGLHDVAKLLDFGLVRSGPSADGPQSPREEGLSGSPLYMSPEQADGGDAFEPHSDLYSLGAVAYYLLTGRPPFWGRTLCDLLLSRSRHEVVPPSHLRASVPADVERIVLHCLKEKAHERFQSAASLQRTLDRCDCAGKWTEEQAAAWWRGIEGGC